MCPHYRQTLIKDYHIKFEKIKYILLYFSVKLIIFHHFGYLSRMAHNVPVVCNGLGRVIGQCGALTPAQTVGGAGRGSEAVDRPT